LADFLGYAIDRFEQRHRGGVHRIRDGCRGNHGLESGEQDLLLRQIGLQRLQFVEAIQRRSCHALKVAAGGDCPGALSLQARDNRLQFTQGLLVRNCSLLQFVKLHKAAIRQHDRLAATDENLVFFQPSFLDRHALPRILQFSDGASVVLLRFVQRQFQFGQLGA